MHLLGLGPLAAGGAVEDRAQLVAGRVADDQLEQEPVELRLGQRIGPFLLDRVLGRHHEERLLEPVDVPPTVTECSCIASSRADWVLGVARLISSASTICEKIGPGWNSKTRRPSGSSMTMLVPMMSAGIRSGVNWIRLKSSVDRVGQGPHQQRLAQARHAFQQRVPADEQAGQDAVDDLVVADDDLGDLGLDPVVGRAELLGAGFHRFG